jgi:predicted dehydrogenase
MIKRVLIVGYGSIGRRHFRLARKLLPNAKILVLKRKITKKKNQNIDLCVNNLRDAIKFKPQIAVIANPASHHLKSAYPLAKLGVHLIIEKPLSSSNTNILKLIKICELKKNILMVGYNLRFLKSLIKFRNILNKDIIGKVLSIRSEVGSFLPSWRTGSDYKKSVSASKKLGGGVLLELSHDIGKFFNLQAKRFKN